MVSAVLFYKTRPYLNKVWMLNCLYNFFDRDYYADAGIDAACRLRLVIYCGVLVQTLNIEMTMH